jgi:hypothetical protein
MTLIGGALVVAGVVSMSGGLSSLGGPGTGATAPPGTAGPGIGAGPTVSPTDATSPPPTEPGASPASDPAAPATAEPPPLADVAVVPVTQFRTTRTATNVDQVAEILAGTSARYDVLELVAADANAILAAIGLEAPAGTDRLVLAPDAATLTSDLAKHRKRLGFLRAAEVTPAVRALAWGKTSLFGNDRVRDLADWPLTARLEAADTDPAFDPGATWTLFAGGDILLDRGVYQTVEINGKGADFPFDGGTAEITSRYCCSSFGWELPRTKRTGDEGAMRRLISGADIAIANFENPAPDRPRWHTSGTVFTADPKLVDGLVDAGLDYVSLANNHIGDAGRAGILQTIRNLDERGLVTGGAGKNEAAARKPALFEVEGTTVAILAYDRIARSYFATADRAGSAPMSVKRVATDVRKAREAGADVVIVFPHWGVEYRARPTESQRAVAHDIIEAGADMIIGNHAHYAAAMEVHQGRPIWYALGNFVFDQTWSEPTMEGITLELTFHGGELAQVRMRPHIILDKAQPNFLEPAGDGRVVMRQVFDASKGLLPW